MFGEKLRTQAWDTLRGEVLARKDNRKSKATTSIVLDSVSRIFSGQETTKKTFLSSPENVSMCTCSSLFNVKPRDLKTGISCNRQRVATESLWQSPPPLPGCHCREWVDHNCLTRTDLLQGTRTFVKMHKWKKKFPLVCLAFFLLFPRRPCAVQLAPGHLSTCMRFGFAIQHFHAPPRSDFHWRALTPGLLHGIQCTQKISTVDPQNDMTFSAPC